jgi:hypothetical protein
VAAASYYVGDWGKVEVLSIAAGIDLTGCTGRAKIKKPSGVLLDVAATLDVALRTISYTWVQTPLDLDQGGNWRIWGEATKAGVFVAATDPADFTVGWIR